MQSLLNELPGKSQLTGLLDGKFNAGGLGVDGLRDIDAAGMKREIGAAAPEGADGGVSLPVMPNGITKEGFLGRVNAPLDQLSTVNRGALVGSVTNNPLPVNLPAPTFDVNATMGQITSKVIPAQVSTPTSAPAVPWIDFDAFADPLRRLGNAGASTPMRLLGMLLKIVESFKNTITDPAKMTQMTTEALAEIYVAQLRALRFALPLNDVNAAITLLEGGFLDQYEQALAVLAGQDIDAFQDLGRAILLPGLQAGQKTNQALQSLTAKDVAAINRALKDVLDFGTSDEVFLQPYFTSLTERVTRILGDITAPVRDLAAMATKIEQYLKDAAAKAEQVARDVGTTIESNITNVEKLLNDVQTQITAVAGEIEAFLKQVDVGPVVARIKDGCNRLGNAIEQFFVRVEEIKIKLDTAVAKVQANVDQQLTATFNALEQQIRQLLAKITEVLNRPEVKDALNKARQGIEDFKTKIGDASLKPVFDLVIQQTTKLEGNVRALDVARMGTPQKTALKVGAKVIEAVKVDEIIKPELIEAFRQIREPLQELIHLLKDKVLVVEQMIDEFNPGTIATDAILNSGPYQLIINTLEEFRPSKLLEPLKDANAELAKIVASLDPQIILDELQRLFDRLYELVEALAPESLTRLINRALDGAVDQLTRVRDYDVPSIVATIKSTISLEKLLAGTGIQEIADAEFWTMLKKTLGGEYLDEITLAMDTIEAGLRANAAALVFPSVRDEIDKTKAAFKAELAAGADDLAAKTARLNTLLGDAAVQISRLQQRRRELLTTYDPSTGTGALLRDLDLAPLVTLTATAAQVNGLAQADLRAMQTVVKTALKAEETRMAQLGEAALQGVVAAMFKRQFGDPVRKFVVDIKVQLKPFTDAITAIQNIIRTIVKLPAEIDAAVGNILDVLSRSIVKVINGVLKNIEALRAALVGTINATYEMVKRNVEAFSPYWLLNSFAASDFAGAGGTPTGLLAVARRIRNPSGDRFAALIQTKLTAVELELLQNEPAATLNEANRANLIKAVNAFLRDSTLSTSATIDLVTQNLTTAINQIQAKPAGSQTADDMKKVYRYLALKGQLGRAWHIYSAAQTNVNGLFRLNRVLLEASYPEDIGMSLQSLHPFIVEEIAHLYPEATVARLDEIYVKVIDKVKQLPDQLIRRPLDDEFNKIKTLLHQSFDIEGLFNVIDIKLAGLDGDLAQGLDRLSHAYTELLHTLDQRLAG